MQNEQILAVHSGGSSMPLLTWQTGCAVHRAGVHRLTFSTVLVHTVTSSLKWTFVLELKLVCRQAYIQFASVYNCLLCQCTSSFVSNIRNEIRANCCSRYWLTTTIECLSLMLTIECATDEWHEYQGLCVQACRTVPFSSVEHYRMFQFVCVTELESNIPRLSFLHGLVLACSLKAPLQLQCAFARQSLHKLCTWGKTWL